MARIIYKPHCSKCGAVINDKVMYKTIELVKLEKGIGWCFGNEYTSIYPSHCEVCGEYFDCIEITPPINLTKEEDYDR